MESMKNTIFIWYGWYDDNPRVQATSPKKTQYHARLVTSYLCLANELSQEKKDWLENMRAQQSLSIKEVL